MGLCLIHYINKKKSTKIGDDLVSRLEISYYSKGHLLKACMYQLTWLKSFCLWNSWNCAKKNIFPPPHHSFAVQQWFSLEFSTKGFYLGGKTKRRNPLHYLGLIVAGQHRALKRIHLKMLENTHCNLKKYTLQFWVIQLAMLTNEKF